MRFLVRFMLILTICYVRTDVNDLWKSFETNGNQINKTNLFIQYEQLCPILNGGNVWLKNKDLRVQKGDCLIGKCIEELLCQITGTCCHRSPFGYLTTSIFDPLAYPVKSSTEKYLIVDQCPYDIFDEIKQKCEHSGTKPVTSISTRIIYKNLFCAHCHGENETTNWKLVINCPDVHRTKTEKLLKDCFIQYKPQNPSVHRRLRDISQFKKSYLISKCNDTGLWKVYDRDVDWACQRFQRPYRMFKNLFCYMCNPSAVSTQTRDKQSLISKCKDDSESRIKYNQSKLFTEINASIPEMCKYSDIVPRLSPFRNAYCLSCYEKNSEYFIDLNIGKFQILSFTNRSFLVEVTIFNEDNKSFTADTFRGKVEQLLKLFVNSTKEVKIPFRNESDESATKEKVNIRNQKTLIEGWSKMCPLDRICTKPYEKVKFSEIINQCRTNCLCNQTCLLRRDLKCCFSEYVAYNAHACIQESSFPVVMNDELESSADMKSHRVVDTCILGNEDNYYKQKCQNGEISDLLTNIPVLSKDKSTLPFKNIFCLLCNNVLPADEVKIYLRVRCRTFFEIELLPTLHRIIEAIKYHQCKVSIALNDRSLRLHKCELDVKTISREKLDFVCLGESISKGSGKDVDNLCANDELPAVVNSVSRQYVNCPICDKITGRQSTRISTVVQCRRENDSTLISEHLCFVEDPTNLFMSRTNSYFKVPNNYRSLFSISEIEFERLKHVGYNQCRQGTFDIKMGTCTRLYCSNDRTLENGSCINVLESVVNTTFLTSLTLQPCKVSDNSTEIVSADAKLSNQTIILDKDIEMKTDSICEGIYKAIDNIFENEIINTYVSCQVRVYDCKTKGYGMQNDLDNSLNVFNISAETSIHVNISVHVKSSNQKSHIESQLYSLSRKRLFQVNQIILCPSKRTEVKDSVLCSKQNFCIPNDTLEFKNNVYYDLVKIKKTLFCPLIKIKVTNALIDETSGNIVFNYLDADLSVPLNSVDAIDTINLKSTILVCKTDLILPERIYRIKGRDMQKAYFLFSTSCNVVSILSLVITLLTYSMFKVLRTVPGNNNVNLALCLLLAQASLQFPHVSLTSETKGYHFIQCQAFGVFVHYFWLATFCALNICSFHMYKVFSGRLMLVQSQLKSVLPKYTLYVYGCPFLIILAVISVNMAASGSFGYGVYRCFLDDLYPVIGAFLLPSCLIFISNAIFYVNTFYIIYNSPTLRCNIEERSTLVIYVKLCTLTGLTWPLLFIDALFPMSVFSFIAAFTNAMQGFFIFISFICNRRVLNLYRNSISGQQEPNTVSNNIDAFSRGQSLKRSP